MYVPFKEKLCAICGCTAQILYVADGNHGNNYMCWKCFGYNSKEKEAGYWEERAKHYANEAKYMGLSVKMAWGQLEIANKRLAKNNIKMVFNEREEP